MKNRTLHWNDIYLDFFFRSFFFVLFLSTFWLPISLHFYCVQYSQLSSISRGHIAAVNCITQTNLDYKQTYLFTFSLIFFFSISFFFSCPEVQKINHTSKSSSFERGKPRKYNFHCHDQSLIKVATFWAVEGKLKSTSFWK